MNVNVRTSRFNPLTYDSGAIASFNASYVSDLIVKANITAVQSGSGNPAPDNVRPISGFDSIVLSHCGANVWNEEWQVGGYEPATGNYYAWNDRICSKNYIPVKPNCTYYYKSGAGITAGNVFYYDADKNFIFYEGSKGNNTFTTPSNCYYLNFTVATSYGTTYNNDISINYPSTNRIYRAYNGGTDTIDFGQDVYGGTLNVSTGLLTMTIDKLFIDDWSSVSFVYSGEADNRISYYFTVSGRKRDTFIMCNKLTPNLSGEPYGIVPVDSSNYTRVYFALTLNETPNKTATEAKQWFIDEGLQVVVNIATPITVQLDPVVLKSIVGTNNIFVDSGNIGVIHV